MAIDFRRLHTAGFVEGISPVGPSFADVTVRTVSGGQIVYRVPTRLLTLSVEHTQPTPSYGHTGGGSESPSGRKRSSL